jgi:hypothetical protein
MSSTLDIAEAALECDLNEQFRRESLPPILAGSDFVEVGYWDEIRCEQCGGEENMELKQIGGERKYVCRNLHQKPGDAGVYYSIQTEDAIHEVLGDVSFENIERQGDVYFGEVRDSRIAIVPGEYQETTLGNLEEYLRDFRNLFIVSFDEETRSKLDDLVARMGGLSVVVAPPGIDRKFHRFDTLIEARNRIEETYDPQHEDTPQELVKEVHDNPLRIASRLVDFEKIQDDSDLRDEMEELCSIAFAQLGQFPMQPLGMSQTGNRVPDGLGFLFDEDHSHTTLVMLDSKSVSAKTRDYPTITEGEGPQYRKYLEIADDICTQENVENKALVFIAPEFNDSKIEDFLDELDRSPFDDFQVDFLRLDGLSILLFIRFALVSDRKIRLNMGRWQQLLENLFLSPDFNKSERDYELAEKGGVRIDRDVVVEHLENSITDQKNKDEILNRITEKFIKYGPHDP